MSRHLGIGNPFPAFSLTACVSTTPGEEFVTIQDDQLKGQWSVIFFWPLDFTFVCPTEIVGFNTEMPAFKERHVQVFGASADSHFVHLAWRNDHPGLKELAFPMLADYKKELSRELGILEKDNEVPLRATFIVDPDGVIQWVNVNGLNVGRNVSEVLRVVDALQSGELTPCNWQAGQETISV